MQIGSAYSTATPRIALIESSMPVCWIRSSDAPPAIGEPGADPDPFVLLADADEARILCLRERAQQAFAGGDVGHRDDELDVARLDLANDAAAQKGRFVTLLARADLHGAPSLVSSGATIQAGRAGAKPPRGHLGTVVSVGRCVRAWRRSQFTRLPVMASWA